MSYSTVLGVTPGQRPQHLAELTNSWGWAASIWGRLTQHHGFGDWLTNQQGLELLVTQIEDLPEWQQAPLVLTFDTGVIPQAFFSWAAEQLDEFERRLQAPAGHVNHIPVVADLLRSGPEVPFIGVWSVSFTENPFDPWDDDGPGSGIPLRAMYLLGRHWDYLANNQTREP